MVILADEHDYFFAMYIVYFVAEAWLALLALAHYPSTEHMEPLPEDLTLLLYEVRVGIFCCHACSLLSAIHWTSLQRPARSQCPLQSGACGSACHRSALIALSLGRWLQFPSSRAWGACQTPDLQQRL